MSQKIKNVLVVGGGIGGLSVGIGLRKAGVHVTIAEIQPEFKVYGVGIIQMANALRALDALGVADEAMKRGSPYGSVKLCTPLGHPIGEAGVSPIGRFPIHNGISRRILHDILYEGAVSVGVEFKMGTTFESINNQPDKVDVVLTDGTSATYDLLIAADGLKSKIRNTQFQDYKPDYVGLSVWRYAFQRPASLETGYMYFGKKSKLGVIPMTATMCYMFIVSAEGADNPAIPEDQLMDKFKDYMQEYPVAMIQELIPQVTNPKEIIYRPMETVHMTAPWYKNRVVVIGDAAHATIPQLGSGAALAIEDAVVLAELVKSNEEVNQILDSYMKRRFDRCEMVVSASETLGQWELLTFEGKSLPEGANMGALMGMTLAKLSAPI